MATRSGGKYRAWIRPFRHWWKPLTWIWGVLILGVVINVGSSMLISKSFDVSGTPLGWVIGHPTIILPPIGGLILLTCLAGFAHRQEGVLTVQETQQLALTPQQRLQLLHSFHQEYGDRLAQKLQGSVALDLELHNRTDMVASSAKLVFRDRETGEASPLPKDTSILQAYDRVQRGLLILGASGSGKTTLLLTLARDLLRRAENEPDQPLTIILNLSSWAGTRLPLEQWLAQQCVLVYGIPKRFMAAWIAQEQVQFLLDGLDEVEISARTACIEAINAYRQEHLVPLVVCSRRQEYESQQARLILPGAVEIQPLKLARILQAPEQPGNQLEADPVALRHNAVLNDLLSTPLMLSIFLLIYRDITAKELPQKGSPEELRRAFFEHYVRYMLQRYQQRLRFSLAQMTTSLIWLAQQMQQHQLTEFHLESLQADWLRTRSARVTYHLVCALLGGLVAGLFGVLFSAQGVGLVFGLGVGLLSGLGVGSADNEPVEKIAWRWKRAGVSLFVGLGVGLFVGLFNMLGVGGMPRLGLFGALGMVLFFGMLFGVILGGLSGVALTKDVRRKPNQGIHTSGWNALRLGLVGFLLGGFAGFLPGSPLSGLPIGVLGSGLFVGLLVGLLFGGAIYVRHYVLRLVLAQSRVLPWRVVPFLEEVKGCILLQRVGGGYQFFHYGLQEYFASQATASVTP